MVRLRLSAGVAEAVFLDKAPKACNAGRIPQEPVIVRFGEHAVGPAGIGQPRNVDADLTLLQHQHASAVRMAPVDRALALDRRAIARLDDFGHEIEAIRIGLVAVAVVDDDHIRLRI
jgi:hypothetical protein